MIFESCQIFLQCSSNVVRSRPVKLGDFQVGGYDRTKKAVKPNLLTNPNQQQL